MIELRFEAGTHNGKPCVRDNDSIGSRPVAFCATPRIADMTCDLLNGDFAVELLPAFKMLPHDIHENTLRAIAAMAAIRSHETARNGSVDPDPSANVKDLLTNLMHLCTLAGMDFDELLQCARSNYEIEWKAIESKE